MKIYRNVISSTQIDLIKKSISKDNTNKYIKDNHGYDIDNLINYSNIIYCDINNKILNGICSGIIDDKEKIYSIHWIEYKVGSMTHSHLDRLSHNTYIILLSDNFTGGKLLVDNVDVGLNLGDVVSFVGNREHHQVTEITSGIREVLVIWTHPIGFKKPVL